MYKYECIYKKILIGNIMTEETDESIENASHKCVFNIIKYNEDKDIAIEDKYIFKLEKVGACCLKCKKIITFEGKVDEINFEEKKLHKYTYVSKNNKLYKIDVDQIC